MFKIRVNVHVKYLMNKGDDRIQEKDTFRSLKDRKEKI